VVCYDAMPCSSVDRWRGSVQVESAASFFRAKEKLSRKKKVTCYNQMIVAIGDVLTSFIFIFMNDNR
jgi:hypothetical protein